MPVRGSDLEPLWLLEDQHTGALALTMLDLTIQAGEPSLSPLKSTMGRRLEPGLCPWSPDIIYRRRPLPSSCQVRIAPSSDAIRDLSNFNESSDILAILVTKLQCMKTYLLLDMCLQNRSGRERSILQSLLLPTCQWRWRRMLPRTHHIQPSMGSTQSLQLFRCSGYPARVSSFRESQGYKGYTVTLLVHVRGKQNTGRA